jgi:hypothetical protein
MTFREVPNAQQVDLRTKEIATRDIIIVNGTIPRPFPVTRDENFAEMICPDNTIGSKRPMGSN